MVVKKKPASKKSESKSESKLGEAVIVYTKSSSHWSALIEPKITEIEGLKFIDGIQVTGKTGHRMERKRTLIPFDHVASIIEFASEDDLWSEPQAKHIRAPEEESQTVLLTSHEQKQPEPSRPNSNNRHHNNRRDRNRGPRHGNGNDARYQERYDSRRKQDF